jgi:acyl-CoA reductase-like NAD-dependent aldehyde dehydrogenase
VYVHADVADDFLGALVPKVEALVVGDPLDENTDVSSLISTDDRDRVSSWVEEATQQGAEVLCGGKVEGSLLWPTVLANARPDMEVCREEIFGPVVAVQTYTDFDAALALANDTKFGLQAAVFTRDLPKALAAARTLDFGGVLVNEVPTWRADQMPYGGVRDSGNTREGPAYAAREMTETRLVVIQP